MTAGDEATPREHDGAATSSERAMAEDNDLRDSLTAPSQLATGQIGLEEALIHVAAFAVLAIPGADGAGLTLLEEGRSSTIVATSPFVTEVDAIQYGLGQGPCISAVTESRTMTSGSLGGDGRWPQFGSTVARLGVHSVVSLPLLSGTTVMGAMNVYAHSKHAFDARAAVLGELFAVPAAIAVQNAQALAQTRRLAQQLQGALETRGAIDRAVGILMSRGGGSPAQALDRLRVLSQNQKQKMPELAQVIADEAVATARARHAD